jgi:hypothetical protein
METRRIGVLPFASFLPFMSSQIAVAGLRVDDGNDVAVERRMESADRDVDLRAKESGRQSCLRHSARREEGTAGNRSADFGQPD